MSSSPPWFYLCPLPSPDSEITLDPREAKHATGSKRLSAGDSLLVFDGAGLLAPATLIEATRKNVKVLIGEPKRQAPPSPAIHVGSALPKGDRLTTLLSMITQLGATSFQPLLCERSVVVPPELTPDRWQRVAIEACKQSRRLHLPALLPPVSPVEFVESHSTSRVAILHPGGSSVASSSTLREAPGDRAILVGPEGGFTEPEVEACSAAGAVSLSIASGILRIETAAVAAVAQLTGQRSSPEVPPASQSVE